MHRQFLVLALTVLVLAACTTGRVAPNVVQDDEAAPVKSCLGGRDSEGEPIGPLRKECL